MRIVILAVVALLASSFEVPKVYSDFIDTTLEEVEALSFSTGVPVSIIYAQVIIESGAGRSNLSKKWQYNSRDNYRTSTKYKL